MLDVTDHKNYSIKPPNNSRESVAKPKRSTSEKQTHNYRLYYTSQSHFVIVLITIARQF